MERGRVAVRKREAARRVRPRLRPEVFNDPGFGSLVAEFARVLGIQDESKAARLLHKLGQR